MSKWAIIGIAIAIVFSILVYVKSLQGKQGSAAQQNAEKKLQPPPKDIYLKLREMALKSNRVKIGLPPVSAPDEPWGVLMDWRLDSGGLATVVAFSDGSASIYLMSGGGSIGGKSHESVRLAAIKMVKIAAEVRSEMRKTREYPLPERPGVIFYVLTDGGVITSSASEEEMRTNRSRFSKLGGAAQEVITQYRLIEEKKLN